MLDIIWNIYRTSNIIIKNLENIIEYWDKHLNIQCNFIGTNEMCY